MPVGQYDTAIQPQFINTYVPIPFEQIAGALQNRQRQYEQTANRITEIPSALRDVETHALDEGIHQQKISNLEEELYNLQKENPDLSSLEAKMKLNKITSTMTRDPFFRAATYNLPILQQAEKNVSEAYAQRRPWAALEDIRLLKQYKDNQGAVGFGKIATTPGDLPTPTSIVDLLESMGKGFEDEGFTHTWDTDSGDWRRVEGSVGVHPEDVAARYGFSIVSDESGNPILRLDRVPEEVFIDPDSRELRMMAQFEEEFGGTPFDETFAQAYEQAAAPLVAKYSGLRKETRATRTRIGLDRLEEGDERIRIMSDVHRVLNRDKSTKFKPNKKGRFYQALDYLGYWLPGLGKTTAADVLDQMIDDLEKGNITYEDVHSQLEGMKTAVAMHTLPILFETDRTPGGIGTLPFNFALNTLDLIMEAGYNERIPENPSEDYINIATSFLPEGKTLKELEGTEEGKELNRKVLNYVDNFKDRDISFEIEVFSGKEKDKYDTPLLGQQAENGVIQHGEVTGVIRQLKIYDPEEPTSEKTFNEIGKKGDTVEIIGKAAVDNDYNGGLVQFSVNDKTYYALIDDAETLGGLIQEFDDWMLYDYKRHASGIGSWNRMGDNVYRTKLVDGTHDRAKKVAVEVASFDQFNNALQNDLISKADFRGSLPGSTTTYINQEEEPIVDFFERLKNEGIIPR